MDLVSRHGDGRAHRSWLGVQMTVDPWSFYIPSGTPVREADGTSWSSPYPVVAMFWPARFYQVFLLLKPDVTEYYCNVIAPIRYVPGQSGPTVEFYDLELDVYVSETGPESRDELEFAVAKVNYPDAWIWGALGAQEELLKSAKQRKGPFAQSVADYWRR